MVDNTFASPYLQQPLALGADVVVHSTTKYVGGHSDVVGGALVVADAELGERLALHQNAMGAVAGPFDAWLMLRGLKTLGGAHGAALRQRRAGRRVPARHPKVAQVLYPGLPDHPGHEVAAKQMRRFGGMVSFRVGRRRGGSAVAVCDRTRAVHPRRVARRRGVADRAPGPDDPRQRRPGSPLEVPADLVRLSVGIETIDDLLADLSRGARLRTRVRAAGDGPASGLKATISTRITSQISATTPERAAIRPVCTLASSSVVSADSARTARALVALDDHQQHGAHDEQRHRHRQLRLGRVPRRAAARTGRRRG